MIKGRDISTNQRHRNMLVFHSAYTYSFIKSQNLDIFVTSRDANDIFSKVLTVNSVASLQGASNQFIFHQLNKKNIILEGGPFNTRVKGPKFLSFFISQIEMLLTVSKWLKENNVSVIRGEDPRLNGIYAYIFSRFLKVPYIVGVWGNPDRIRRLTGTPLLKRFFLFKFVEAYVEKFILLRADLVLAQNSENLSYPLAVGVKIEKRG